MKMTQKTNPSPDFFENVNPIFYKKGRLETFHNWPFKVGEHKCNPEQMAEAGFYSIGGADEPDLVECFVCCKQLNGWEPDDDPWLEHIKHQSDCLFVKLDKRNEMSLTIADSFQLLQAVYKNVLRKNLGKAVESLTEQRKKLANVIPDLCEAKRRSRKH